MTHEEAIEVLQTMRSRLQEGETSPTKIAEGLAINGEVLGRLQNAAIKQIGSCRDEGAIMANLNDILEDAIQNV